MGVVPGYTPLESASLQARRPSRLTGSRQAARRKQADSPGLCVSSAGWASLNFDPARRISISELLGGIILARRAWDEQVEEHGDRQAEHGEAVRCKPIMRAAYSYCAWTSAFSIHWRYAFEVRVAPLMVSTWSDCALMTRSYSIS